MKAHALLAALSKCLCDTITASSVPNVCFCGVVSGDSVVADFAGCVDGENQGMAWVRMTSLYPAAGVNVPDESVHNCNVAFGMDLELGMARPVHLGDDIGNPPTADEYEATSQLTNDDALVMMQALACCDRLQDLDYTVGSFVPSGPLGGVLVGTWPVAVILD